MSNEHQKQFHGKKWFCSVIIAWWFVVGCTFTHETPYIQDLSQQAKNNGLPSYMSQILEQWKINHTHLQIGEMMEAFQHVSEGFSLFVGPTETDARLHVQAMLYAINEEEASTGLGKIRVLELSVGQLHEETHDPESCRHKLKQLVEKRVRFVKYKYSNEKPIFFVANVNTLSCTDICQASGDSFSQQQQELCDGQVRETIDFLESTQAGFMFAVDPNTYQRHLRNFPQATVVVLDSISIDDGADYLRAIDAPSSDLDAMVRLNWFYFPYTWFHRASQQVSDGKDTDDVVNETAQLTRIPPHELRQLLEGSQEAFKQRFSAGALVTPESKKQELINDVLTRISTSANGINPFETLINATTQNADVLPQLQNEAKLIAKQLDLLHALGEELNDTQRTASRQIVQKLNSLLLKLSDDLKKNSHIQALQRAVQDLQQNL